MSHRIQPLIFRRFRSSKSKSPAKSPSKPGPKALRPLWLYRRTPQNGEDQPVTYQGNKRPKTELDMFHPAVQRLRESLGIAEDWYRDIPWVLTREQKLNRYREKASQNDVINLLMASIGNPPPYERTRHSAAHIVLDSFSELVGATPVQSHRRKHGAIKYQRAVFKDLNVSLSLWKSESLMNTSGVSLADAFDRWMQIESQPPTVRVPGNKLVEGLSERVPSVDKMEFRRGFKKTWKVADRAKVPQLLQMILLHDELEQPLGKISVRYGGVEMSSRGHNGIKSVVKNLGANQLLAKDSLKSNIRFPLMMRVGIGVGRPAERTPQAVSDYLLGPMPDETYNELRDLAPRLRDVLRKELVKLELVAKEIKIIDKPPKSRPVIPL